MQKHIEQMAGRRSGAPKRALCELRTIRFEDEGQDFLEWDIDRSGKVVACRPCQAWAWIGCVVLRHRTIRPAQHITIVSNRTGKSFQISHRVLHVAPYSRKRTH